ncbi:hypothetical protein E4U44_006873 [Claviceps purpurea]|nr:hypothetical protein E4U45_000698 [Claviceps purpurea]KAG6325289.1 hypothetical protein E4U44_006873 [Claviceps purpurea]
MFVRQSRAEDARKRLTSCRDSGALVTDITGTDIAVTVVAVVVSTVTDITGHDISALCSLPLTNATLLLSLDFIGTEITVNGITTATFVTDVNGIDLTDTRSPPLENTTAAATATTVTDITWH